MLTFLKDKIIKYDLLILTEPTGTPLYYACAGGCFYI